MGAKKRTVAKRTVPSGRRRAEVTATRKVPAQTTAVLLMAYGSAPSPDEAAVRAYLDNILGDYRGATATDSDVVGLKARYEAIGGSPLYEVTAKVAQALQVGTRFVQVHELKGLSGDRRGWKSLDSDGARDTMLLRRGGATASRESGMTSHSFLWLRESNPSTPVKRR